MDEGMANALAASALRRARASAAATPATSSSTRAENCEADSTGRRTSSSTGLVQRLVDLAGYAQLSSHLADLASATRQ